MFPDQELCIFLLCLLWMTEIIGTILPSLHYDIHIAKIVTSTANTKSLTRMASKGVL